ncbi:MAG: hypothetical protein R2942_13670 [Ignavibacteria bacterium]
MTKKDDKYFFELKKICCWKTKKTSCLEKFNLIAISKNYAYRKLNEGDKDFKASFVRSL